MTLLKLRLLLVAGLLSVGCQAGALMQRAAGANLLVKGGFETGDFSGWTIAGTATGSGCNTDGAEIAVTDPEWPDTYGQQYVNVRSGTYAAFAIVASAKGEKLSISQNVELSPGCYRVGFHLGHDATNLAFGGRYDQRILINGIVQSLAYEPDPWSVQLPGSTSADFFSVATESEFYTAGGPTKIEFVIGGSGSARAALSLDDCFLVRVDPVEQIENLIDEVLLLNLVAGVENSLDAKLDAALNALDDAHENNDVAAANSLQAFIYAVESQRGKKISDTAANVLIEKARSALANLGCT